MIIVHVGIHLFITLSEHVLIAFGPLGSSAILVFFCIFAVNNKPVSLLAWSFLA